MYDSFKGFRSRLDDVHLIHELLEEIPVKLGLEPVMPPFILPYYNGINSEDCGISAFVFLAGGHLTIHTFSFRKAFYMDLLYPREFDIGLLENLISNTLPSEESHQDYIARKKLSFFERNDIDKQNDFGPHLFMNFEEFHSPSNMEGLFDLFDVLPNRIGMTPIMRPYVIKSNHEKQDVLSILTMIAESHISLHIFLSTHEAYLDLFSCSFFDYNTVSERLHQEFGGTVTNEILISRGSKYKLYRNEKDLQWIKSRKWLKNINGSEIK